MEGLWTTMIPDSWIEVAGWQEVQSFVEGKLPTDQITKDHPVLNVGTPIFYLRTIHILSVIVIIWLCTWTVQIEPSL